MDGQNNTETFLKIFFFFCFTEKKSYLFEMTWWANDDRIQIFGWSFPLTNQLNQAVFLVLTKCKNMVHQQEAEYILHSQQGVGAFFNFSLTLTIVIEWLLSVINQKVGAWVFIFSLQPKIPLSPFPLHTVCVLFCPVGGAKTVPVQ